MNDFDWIEDIISTSTIYDCRGESLIAILNNHFKAGGYAYNVGDKYGTGLFTIWDGSGECFFLSKEIHDFTMKMIIKEVDEVLKNPRQFDRSIVKEFKDLYRCISELL